MHKKIISLLLVCSFLLSLTACQFLKPKGEPDFSAADVTTSAPGDTTVPDGVTVVAKEDLKNFKLVYSNDIGSMTAVTKLLNQIKSMYGEMIISTSDVVVDSIETMREWEHEILVGVTNREESVSFGESMRNYDYGYGYLNGKVIIYAKNEVFLESAVNSFILNVMMKNKDDGIFYRSDCETKVLYGYKVKKLTVNGADIRDYEIFYPENSTLFEKEMAQSLQSSIQEFTGWILPIKKDSEARGKANAIHMGKTQYAEALATAQPAENEGIICSNGTDVVVYGNNMTGVTNATKKLYSMFFDVDTAGTENNVTINETVRVEAPSTYSTMSFNVYGGDVTVLRKENIVNNILRYLPDTVGIQEFSPAWKTELINKLSDYYEFVGAEVENGVLSQNIEGVPIMYAKEKFNLIESGTHWLTETPTQPSKLPGVAYYRAYTWVLLEDKKTGEQFLHLNTHLDIGGDEYRYEEVRLLMEFLRGYNDVPVVVTGDMNTPLTSAAMKLFKAYGLEDASVFSSEKIEKPPTSLIDWILVSTDCIKMTAHDIDEMLYNGVFPSDHRAFYAEFVLELPENGVIDHSWYVEHNTYPDEWVDISYSPVDPDLSAPIYVSELDRNENGHIEIPAGATEIEIDGVTYRVIRTVEEMNTLAGAGNITENIILANDLDYTGKTFTKIILKNSIFDGNGFAIYGYEMDPTKAVGTFGYAGTTLTIRNLTLGQAGNPVIVGTEASPKSGNLGILAEYLKIPVTLDNVHIYGSIYSNGTSQIGGFTSDMAGGGSAKNCSFTGTIISAAENGANVGGIFANVNGKDFEMKNVTVDAMISTSSGVSAGAARGGIVGKKTSDITLTMTDCVFKGTINGKTRGYFGGLVGWHALGTLKMTDCESYAVINTNGGYVGGLVGYQSGGTLDVIGCENHGLIEITSGLRIGGFIGYIKTTDKTTLKNCVNNGSISSGNTAAGFVSLVGDGADITIDNCLNMGAISGSKGSAGIISEISAGNCTITGCTNIGALSSQTGTAGIVYKSSATALTLKDCISYATQEGDGVKYPIIGETNTAPTVENLLAIENAAYETSPIAYETLTLEEALQSINANLKDSFGAFILNSNGNGIVLATPRFVAIQQATTEEKAGTVRLVGSVAGNTQRYLAVGFEIVVSGSDPVRKQTTLLNRSLNVIKNGNKTKLNASDFGGTFVYTVDLEDLIPAEGTFSISVCAYALDLDGETVYYDTPYLVTFTDGNVVSAVMDTI